VTAGDLHESAEKDGLQGLKQIVQYDIPIMTRQSALTQWQKLPEAGVAWQNERGFVNCRHFCEIGPKRSVFVLNELADKVGSYRSLLIERANVVTFSAS
jgi:uncharacterized protein YodC (DUF2158 family)